MRVGFNHVGVGVADLEAAVRFYEAVLDCRVVRPPFEVRDDAQAVDVLGPPRFGRMVMAHLATPDGVGIEVFRLIDPPHEPRDPPLEYWKSGLFHFCVTDPDIEGRLARLLAHGGRQLSKVWLNQPPDPDKKMVYCADPWGTIIEIYTHPYTDMYA